MLTVFSAIITDKTRNVATNWRRSTKMKRKQKVANKSQKNKITKSMNKIKCIQQILGENEIWCSTFCALLTLTHTSVTVRYMNRTSFWFPAFHLDLELTRCKSKLWKDNSVGELTDSFYCKADLVEETKLLIHSRQLLRFVLFMTHSLILF